MSHAPNAAAPARHAALDRAAAAWVLGSGLYSLAMTARDVRYFLAQSADDAAYYLNIARHAAHGHGFTFDGLSATNGFHPLWAWLLTALSAVLPVSPEGMWRVVWAVQSLLMTAAAWIVLRLLQRTLGSFAAALGSVLFVGRLYYTGRGGMESALLLILVALLLDRCERRDPGGSVPGALGMGALAGLTMLSRLDSVFVVGALLAAWALPSRNLRVVLAAAAAAAAVVAPYLVSNLRDFGHLVPISGMLKSSFPHPGWHVRAFSIQGQDLLVLVAATGVGLAFLASRLLTKPSPGFVGTLLPAVTAGALAHMLYSALFMHWGVFSWHFVLMRMVLALALPALALQWLPPRPGALARLWTLGLAGLLLVSLLPVLKRDWRTDYSQSWTTQAYEAGLWARANTPPDAIFAMRDAGNFGYFSERHVVNTDGLVNTFAYQDSLAAGRFEGYLRSQHVRYFVQHAIHGRPDIADGDYESWTFESFSHLHNRPGGSLTVHHRDEVYRSRPYPDAGQRCAFLIWKLPEP